MADALNRAHPYAFEDALPLPRNAEFQHFFLGLLTLADWIASDPRLFPFSLPGENRASRALELAETALDGIGLATERKRVSVTYPAGPDEATERLIGMHAVARPLQRTVYEAAAAPAALTILEAETGSGKTEAAILQFWRYYAAGAVDGMFVALPTRTAATQMYDRVVSAVARMWPAEEDRPPVVLAVPGYLRVDGFEGTRLEGFQTLWPDEAERLPQPRVWAAEQSKRFLAGAIAVGTIDQVLLSALAVSHSHMRAVALTRQLLVVDEVHASSTYMNRILEAVLDRHVRSGGHAMLLSATLGVYWKNRFVSVACTEQKLKTPGRDLAQASDYPLLSTVERDSVHTHWIGSSGGTKEVEVKLSDSISKPTLVVGKALEMAQAGARVVILRNTVTDCVRTQATLLEHEDGVHFSFSANGRVCPHHSRFATEDRELLDRAVEQTFGKNADDGPGCVLVATQTIQQSLDLDFDYMFTDLCPMDVLLQRVGRLHRHEARNRRRPREVRTPQCTVLVPENRDLQRFIDQSSGSGRGPHGFGTVYEDLRVLDATWAVLLAHMKLSIPADNRSVVEGAMHPEVLKAYDEKSFSWHTHGAYIEGAGITHAQLAQVNLARWDAPFGGGELGRTDWLFPSVELESQIATRLGVRDLYVQLPEHTTGPFGEIIRRLAVPGWMVGRSAIGEEPAEVERVADGELAIRLGRESFRYDTNGLMMVGEGTV